jgi:hypothetical protein
MFAVRFQGKTNNGDVICLYYDASKSVHIAAYAGDVLNMSERIRGDGQGSYLSILLHSGLRFLLVTLAIAA